MGTDNKPKSGTGNPDNKKRKQQYRPHNICGGCSSIHIYIISSVPRHLWWVCIDTDFNITSLIWRDQVMVQALWTCS
ncbi:hypothetical protein L2E82_49514 [Cichorium intybus]|uniref:Uncharacterized protein n=1 Tax=Cichorium intybus TaxID=13427 RepID=A0ACB8YZS3_CICIN|nr:hypothetical protein L2E82_49514 [Cichorium intybus]